MIFRRGKSLAECSRDEALASAERERITAIRSLESLGQDPVISELIAQCKKDGHCTPGMAALRIVKLERTPAVEARRILRAHHAAGGRVLANDAQPPETKCACEHTLSQHDGDMEPCTTAGCECKQFDAEPPAATSPEAALPEAQRILAAHRQAGWRT
jgi:hypothetical protein